jgi:FMN phosphatase YigB (HAD superfamily)
MRIAAHAHRPDGSPLPTDIDLSSTALLLDVDGTLLDIAPTPDAAYAFELSYYERPTPLSDTIQTSWTTQYAPQLLLYASLLEAQPFLKMPERIAEFQAMYDRSLQALMQEDQSRIMDASA